MSRETRVEGLAGARRWARWAVLSALALAPLACDQEGSKAKAAEAPRASLADGWFKENCAMGFEVHGGVYTEWADAPKQVVEFRGETVNTPDLTATRGVLVLRITAGSDAYPEGRYTVVRWSDFDGATVEKRVASKGSEDATRATAAAALAELTVEGGWFGEFCCPFAVRYTTPRLSGSWSGDGGGGLDLARVGTGTEAVYQLTWREGDAVLVQGTVDRASDLTAPGGYLRVLVTDGGTAKLTAGQYTVVAWRALAERKVEVGLAQADGAYASVAEKSQAHLVFTVEAGSFVFRPFTR